MGRIGAAHGIKGEVRIQSFTDDAMALAAYHDLSTDKSGVTVRILSARPAGNSMLVARLDGVADRTAAEKLNGLGLYVSRDRLPAHDEDEDYYHADLVGLVARLADGTSIGTVSAIPNFGAGDILEVRGPAGGETFLFPFNRAVVPEVNIAAGYLVIVPPLDAEPGEEEPD